MRIPAVLLLACLTTAACQEGNTSTTRSSHTGTVPDSVKRTTLEWVDSIRDYGIITEGQKLEVSFDFRNTGNYPLVFYTIAPSCGCTVVEQPEKPVMPGESGTIKGVFDSAGKTGAQHKTIRVLANTADNQVRTLEFKVMVNAASK